MRRLIVSFLLMVATSIAYCDEPLRMFVGEVKVLKLKPIERVAVGNSALLSTSLLKNGQLLILAEGQGDTHMHLWYEDGKEAHFQINITQNRT